MSSRRQRNRNHSRTTVSTRPKTRKRSEEESVPDSRNSGMTKDKQIAFTAIEQQMNEVHSIGQDLWRYSELPGKEERSAKRITQFLRKKGFKIQENYLGFKHSFRAEFVDTVPGSEDAHEHPNICLLCQYDAEEAGHVKGHNLVPVTAIAAAMGLQAVIMFAKEPMGKITVVGCPSNKDNTLKSNMFEKGFFKDIDFILCGYPSHYTNISPTFLASKTYGVVYKGRSRYEGNKPWETANPVNATVLAYQNVGACRQQFKPNWEARSVITSAGSRADVTPSTAHCQWLLRAPTPDDMALLDSKVTQCLEAAGTATGCSYQIKPIIKESVVNISCSTLRELYVNNATLNGFTFHNIRDENEVEGPDDIALVSTSIPVLKVLYYNGHDAEPGSDEFNRYSGTKECEFAQEVQGKTLAMVAVDLITSDDEMKTVFEQHQRELGRLYCGTRPDIQSKEF